MTESARCLSQHNLVATDGLVTGLDDDVGVLSRVQESFDDQQRSKEVDGDSSRLELVRHLGASKCSMRVHDLTWSDYKTI